MPLTIDIRKSGLYQEGIAVGKAEDRREVAEEMLKSGSYSMEQILKLSRMSVEEIETIKKDLDK